MAERATIVKHDVDRLVPTRKRLIVIVVQQPRWLAVVASGGTDLDANTTAHWVGVLIGGFTAGALLGLIPFRAAQRRKREGLAIGTMIACVVSGLCFGALLALPVSLVLYAVTRSLGDAGGDAPARTLGRQPSTVPPPA